MSRLTDKFQKLAQSSAQPMGFRTARTAAAEPGLLLIVSAAPEEIKNTNEFHTAGAVLVRPNDTPPTPKSVQKIAAILPDVPMGLYLEDGDDAEIASLTEAGCDFLVFPTSSRISTPPADKKPGRVLQVEAAMDDSLLRSVNSLPVDAVMLTDSFTGGALSWHELMIFQHLSNTLNKPLIINIPADVSESELKALFEAGADGALVEASTLKPGGLERLQELIGKLPPRSARQRGKVEVRLPRVGGEGPSQPPPDEEEEEE